MLGRQPNADYQGPPREGNFAAELDHRSLHACPQPEYVANRKMGRPDPPGLIARPSPIAEAYMYRTSGTGVGTSHHWPTL